MSNVIAATRDAFDTFLYGRSSVTCENCGATVRSSRAVWRGAKPYCSAAHEHADFEISPAFPAVRTDDSASLTRRDGCPVGPTVDARRRKTSRLRDARTRPIAQPSRSRGY